MTFVCVGCFVRCLFQRRGIVMAVSLSAILLHGPVLAQSQWSGTSPGPIYYNGGNVGIGTTGPGTTLELYNSVQGTIGPTLKLNNPAGGSGGGSSIDFQGSNSATQMITARIQTMDDGNWSSNLAFFTKAQSSGGALIEKMRLTSTGNLGIGTTTPVHPLQVVGTIGATEVIVSSTGADYVFASNYRLRDLSEVAAFIQQNHHLPDIPSEAEVREKGIGVGEMQTKLLAKIEELTLHMIQAEQTNNELKQQNRELLERVMRLEKSEGK